jgi:hypothetical protein
MALFKDGEDQLARLCKRCRNITMRQRGKEYLTKNKEKADWIGQIFRRNCCLKHVIVGNIGGKIEVKGRRERRRKQLLDAVMEKREC